MVKKLHAVGFDECKKLIDEHEKAGSGLFLLFSGSKDELGANWCPDCIQAEPVIEEALKSAPKDAIFIHVEVGDHPFWKDKENAFRKDDSLSLKCVPTLMQYGTALRLEEGQCAELDTVKMLFEDS